MVFSRTCAGAAALAGIAEVFRPGGCAIISVGVDETARSESTVPEVHAPGDAIPAFSRDRTGHK